MGDIAIQYAFYRFRWEQMDDRIRVCCRHSKALALLFLVAALTRVEFLFYFFPGVGWNYCHGNAMVVFS